MPAKLLKFKKLIGMYSGKIKKAYRYRHKVFSFPFIRLITRLIWLLLTHISAVYVKFTALRFAAYYGRKKFPYEKPTAKPELEI